MQRRHLRYAGGAQNKISQSSELLYKKRQALMSLPLSYHDYNNNLLKPLPQSSREPRLH